MFVFICSNPPNNYLSKKARSSLRDILAMSYYQIVMCTPLHHIA